MKTLKINDVTINKDKNNKLTFILPNYITGILFSKFKKQYELKISEFKNNNN